MASRMPPPFVCEHPRTLWDGYGTWVYSTHAKRVEGGISHYVCRGCGTYIPADAITDEEWVRQAVDRVLSNFGPAFDMLGDS